MSKQIFEGLKDMGLMSFTPSHYGTDKTDTIAYMKQHCTHEEVRGFLKGNVFKYLTRAEKKNGPEDYEKAAHYMTMLLEWEAKG